MLRSRFEYADELPALPSSIMVAGHALIPVAAGALYWQSERTFIVADLHLEKGAAFAARGQMLPPYDTRSTLNRLATCIERFNPRSVIALGDSFHRSELAERLNASDREELADVQRGRDWYWVLGNHDPLLPPSLGGVICFSLVIGGITLRHEPSAEVGTPEIAGHLHPVARIACRGEGIRRRCFATDGHRMVMPAFGAYTGGLNVLDPAFSSLFHWHRMEAWLTGRLNVYPLQASLLLPD
jgi:DNA ligase-associated metallophosphoesterase